MKDGVQKKPFEKGKTHSGYRWIRHQIEDIARCDPQDLQKRHGLLTELKTTIQKYSADYLLMVSDQNSTLLHDIFYFSDVHCKDKELEKSLISSLWNIVAKEIASRRPQQYPEILTVQTHDRFLVLHSALKKGVLLIVQEIFSVIAQNPAALSLALTCRTKVGLNCLQSSIFSNNVAVIDEVIQQLKQQPQLLARAILAKSKDNYTLLHEAIKNGNTQVVSHILQLLTNLRDKNPTAFSHDPLIFNLNSVTNQNYTILHDAIHHKDHHVLELIINLIRTDIKHFSLLLRTVNNHGFGLLHQAIQTENLAKVQAVVSLLQLDPTALQVNLLNKTKKKYSVLVAALGKKMPPLVEYIISLMIGFEEILQTNLESITEDGFSVLTKALDSKDPPTIHRIWNLLLSNPALLQKLITLATTRNSVPLHFLAITQSVELFNLIYPHIRKETATLKSNLKAITDSGWTTLYYAVHSNQPQILKTICQDLKTHGLFAANFPQERKVFPLHQALEPESNCDLALTLLRELDEYPDILLRELNSLNKDNYSCLQIALLSEDLLKIVAILVRLTDKNSQEINFTAKTRGNTSPLSTAIKTKKTAVVEKLLEYLKKFPWALQDNLIYANKYNYFPLHEAVRNANPEILDLILKELNKKGNEQALRKNLNSRLKINDLSLIDIAIQSGNPIILTKILQQLDQQRLLEKYLITQSSYNILPLLQALDTGHEEMIDVLILWLKKNSEWLLINLKSEKRSGQTCLHLAANSGNINILGKIIALYLKLLGSSKASIELKKMAEPMDQFNSVACETPAIRTELKKNGILLKQPASISSPTTHPAELAQPETFTTAPTQPETLLAEFSEPEGSPAGSVQTSAPLAELIPTPALPVEESWPETMTTGSDQREEENSQRANTKKSHNLLANASAPENLATSQIRVRATEPRITPAARLNTPGVTAPAANLTSSRIHVASREHGISIRQPSAASISPDPEQALPPIYGGIAHKYLDGALPTLPLLLDESSPNDLLQYTHEHTFKFLKEMKMAFSAPPGLIKVETPFCELSFHSFSAMRAENSDLTFMISGRLCDVFVPQPATSRCVMVLSQEEYEKIKHKLPTEIDVLVIHRLEHHFSGQYEDLTTITARRLAIFYFAYHQNLPTFLMVDDNIKQVKFTTLIAGNNTWDLFVAETKIHAQPYSCVSVKTESPKEIKPGTLGSKLFCINMQKIKEKLSHISELSLLFPTVEQAKQWGEDYYMQIMLHFLFKPDNQGYQVLAENIACLVRSKKFINLAVNVGMKARRFNHIGELEKLFMEQWEIDWVTQGISTLNQLIDHNYKVYDQHLRYIQNANLSLLHSQANLIELFPFAESADPMPTVPGFLARWKHLINELSFNPAVLRPYQFQGIKKLADFEQQQGRYLLATGTGKTIQECEMARLAYLAAAAGQHIIIVTSQINLVRQFYRDFIHYLQKISQHGIQDIPSKDIITISSHRQSCSLGALLLNLPIKQQKAILIFCADSFSYLLKNDENYLQRVPLILLDEYHQNSSLAEDLVQRIKKKHYETIVIGSTATPPAKDPLEPTLFSYHRNEAVNDGFLSPIIADSINLPFAKANVKKLMKTLPVILQTQPHPWNIDRGRTLSELKGIVFLPSINKCEQVAKWLATYHIPTICVHSKKDNKQEVENFIKGDAPGVLLAVYKLRIGFNCESLAWAIIGQNADENDHNSRNKVEQMLGRVMRYIKRKIGYVLSFENVVNNIIKPLITGQTIRVPINDTYLNSRYKFVRGQLLYQAQTIQGGQTPPHNTLAIIPSMSDYDYHPDPAFSRDPVVVQPMITHGEDVAASVPAISSMAVTSHLLNSSPAESEGTPANGSSTSEQPDLPASQLSLYTLNRKRASHRIITSPRREEATAEPSIVPLYHQNFSQLEEVNSINSSSEQLDTTTTPSQNQILRKRLILDPDEEAALQKKFCRCKQ